MDYRLEALDRVLLDVVPGQVGLSIIDREPALSAGITIQIARVNRNNWHAVVGPVRRMLEVQGSSCPKSRVSNCHTWQKLYSVSGACMSIELITCQKGDEGL
jgi:hypothetical protein